MQDTLVSTPALAAPEQDDPFTSLIDSRRDRRPFWRPWVIVTAVGLHVAVLAAILVRNWFEVPAIGAPPLQVEFTHFAPPPPPPAPVAPKPAAPQPVTPRPQPVEVQPRQLVAPTTTPEVVHTTPQAEEPALAGTGVEGGVPDGVAGGVPGGVPTVASGGVPAAVEPMRIGGDVVSPEIVERVRPEYPALARSGRVQGIVILEAVIHRDGSVGDIKVLRGVPMGCTEAAIAALKRYRFKPGTQHGEPVDVYMTLTVQFTLR